MHVCTNSGEIDDQRTGEDEEASVVALEVIYQSQPDSYTLSVFVNRGQLLSTGREV